MHMDRFIGKRLDGRYEIQEIIGIGGMAVVYKAYDNIEDRTVAIKILKEEFVANEEFLRRFKNESKAIAVLSHPNIVKVYDVSFGDLIQYIVMEYIDGITLKEFIERQGSLRWKDAVHFTLQILRALQHAHEKGIVHRDVKPQNIMVLTDGTIKVTDFGIARFARSEYKTMTDKAIGSVHYISPEQARGETTDEKADIYSVGVMLYEMLTGRLPFQAESAVSVAIMQLQTDPQLPREINGSIPLGLEQITMHAMQKDQHKRYQSAAEMLRDLEAFKRDPSMTFSYSYFVDDSPTRYVGGALQNETPEPEIVEDEEEEPRRSSVVPVLAGIAVAVILAIVLLCVFLLPRLFGSSGAELACPNFIGQSFEEIKANPEYAELNINPISYDYNNQYEAGDIYKQEPDPGRSIKKKSTIKVWVSTGKKSLTVPDVYGLDAATAISNLRSHGLTVNQTEEPDEEVAKDRVIRTVPARGESIPEGGEVTIYVSAGPPVVYVDLPSVTGLNLNDAKALILERGLTIGNVTKADSAAPADTVLSQSPSTSEKKQVAKGSSVDLQVSTGVAPESAPSEYTVNLEIRLPDDYETSVYTISAWLEGEEVRSVRVDSSQRHSYTFTLTSQSETANVQIKINNEPYLDYSVNFKEGTAKREKSYTYTPAASTPASSDENG